MPAIPSFPPFPAGLIDPLTDSGRKLMAAVQGNILRPHGRRHACLMFFRFGSGCEVRALLQAVHAAGLVTSALQQSEQARMRAARPNEMFRSLALTSAGLRVVCGFPVDAQGDPSFYVPPLAEYPSASPHADPFNEGMWRHFASGTRESWSAPYAHATESERVHGLWMVACEDAAALSAAVRALREWCAQRGVVALAPVEQGRRWSPGQVDREPFGFADGISGPRFLTTDPADPVGSRWAGLSLRNVLVPPENSAVHAGASFLVLRKLEQNVSAFREHENAVAARLRTHRDPAIARLAEPLAEALIMGRDRSGRPIDDLLAGSRLAPEHFNRFGFKSAPRASACPFHAHIRRMNPRAGPARTPPVVEGTQIVRRSMVYDPDGRLPEADGAWSRDPRQWPDRGVGLLFMAYMSSIKTQFEVLALDWARARDFPQSHRVTLDPVAGMLERVPVAGRMPCVLRRRPGGGGGGTSPCGTWVWKGMSLPLPVPPFVTPRGGDYFYVPSLRWLQAGGDPEKLT